MSEKVKKTAAPDQDKKPELERRLEERSEEDRAQSVSDPPDVRPPNDSAIAGASFDTPQGRAAQGMKANVGGGVRNGGAQVDPGESDPNDPTSPGDPEAQDADSRGGAARGTPGGGTDPRTGGSFDDREPADADQKKRPAEPPLKSTPDPKNNPKG